MMFIAMNRFRVKKGSEQAFEDVWLNRDSQLTKVPGFVEFHLLKGPEHDDFTLYASHTIWTSKATFEAWTNRRRSAPSIRMPVRTSRFTSIIRNSKASRCARPWRGARPQWPSGKSRGLRLFHRLSPRTSSGGRSRHASAMSHCVSSGFFGNCRHRTESCRWVQAS